MGMQAEQQREQPLTIGYGVIQSKASGEFFVMLKFSHTTDKIMLNDAQVEAMMASLRDVQGKLALHRAGPKQ